MFAPHSFLWNLLWVAPNVLLLAVAIIFFLRRFHRHLPVFLLFAIVEGITGLTMYVADIMPSVSGPSWWRMNLVRLMIEVIVKFALIGELFFGVFEPYPSISKLGRTMIRAVGAALVLAATLLALLPRPETIAALPWRVRLSELADFITECGLLVFIFLFAAYFRLNWTRLSFGIAWPLGLTASVHLGTWAFLASPSPSNPLHDRLVILNMAVYTLTVLIWLYYVLTIPNRQPDDPSDRDENRHTEQRSSGGSMDEAERQRTLDVWNSELERLLQR